MTIATVLAWLGPAGKAVTAAGRWIRARVRGREKDWTIAGLVVVILLLLWWTAASRRESAFYRAVNRGLELSLSGTGQNERVLLARIQHKDREIAELRNTRREDRCDGTRTEDWLPDGTHRIACVGVSESKAVEELTRRIQELEAQGALPFIQPPPVPLLPPPSLAPARRSRWSAGAGGGVVRVADAWRGTGYARAGYRLTDSWGADVTLLAPVFGVLAGPALAP